MKKALRIILPLLFVGSQIIAQTLQEGILVTPLAYFDDYEKGYVILRDGTKLSGEVDIKKYEKQGKMDLEDNSGNKYRFAVESLKEWGLDVDVPKNYSPLSYYDWKNNKRKENKDPESGFVELKSGEVKRGKIKVEGWSSDSPLARNNFFALEQITFYDKSGKETVYKRKDLKGFGRILPWNLAPAHMYQSSGMEAFGKTKTKKLDGFAILNDGSRVEGEMQLVSKNSMSTNSKTRSMVPDEIFFQRDGKNDKIELDDIYAYGVNDLTINDITNKGDIKYKIEEMNFHPGKVVKKDGSTLEGLVAYFPEVGNYYGVYVGKALDQPVEIVAMEDVKDVEQQIGTISAFSGYGSSSTNKNASVNGFIVNTSGKKFEGNITINDDHDWYCGYIEFVDKEGNKANYGSDLYEPISFFELNGNTYVQTKDVFVKTDNSPSPLTLYDNPYVDKSNSFGNSLLKMAAAEVGQDLAQQTTRAVWIIQYNTGTLDNTGLGLGANVGSTVGEAFNLLVEKIGKPGKEPEREEGDYNIFNAHTGEIAHADKGNWEMLLEGCYDYHKKDNKEQKTILKDYTEAQKLEFLNTCYSK